MFRLWAKEYDDKNEIIKNETFDFKQEFDVKYLFCYMQVVCNDLKTETPMVLTNHYAMFNNFNRVKFSKSDFVDKVEFNYLTVELI